MSLSAGFLGSKRQAPLKSCSRTKQAPLQREYLIQSSSYQAPAGLTRTSKPSLHPWQACSQSVRGFQHDCNILAPRVPIFHSVFLQPSDVDSHSQKNATFVSAALRGCSSSVIITTGEEGYSGRVSLVGGNSTDRALLRLLSNKVNNSPTRSPPVTYNRIPRMWFSRSFALARL